MYDTPRPVTVARCKANRGGEGNAADAERNTADTPRPVPGKGLFRSAI